MVWMGGMKDASRTTRTGTGMNGMDRMVGTGIQRLVLPPLVPKGTGLCCPDRGLRYRDSRALLFNAKRLRGGGSPRLLRPDFCVGTRILRRDEGVPARGSGACSSQCHTRKPLKRLCPSRDAFFPRRERRGFATSVEHSLRKTRGDGARAVSSCFNSARAAGLSGLRAYIPRTASTSRARVRLPFALMKRGAS